ncbi:MAG TPA: hypothetical protein VEW07_11790 [Solirubrobacterales bacterium]|nr:hypothetical protein [Solirubrobacterales bacterium]
MPRGGVIKAVALCCVLALLGAASAAGEGALVIVNNIVLRADGGFQPRALPRRQFAPIDFQGYFDIAARSGGQPPALEEAVIDFDRDGRLSAGGLPVCPAARVAEAAPARARRVCAGAIVGTGRIEALIGGVLPASSPLTIFNGPPQAGNPTVVLHARTTVPAPQTFAIVVPIERRPGEFRYRATLALPPIAEGLGAVTHVKVKVGRHFRVGGQDRSYVAAHCSDGVLRTHGRFSFADGTIVDGSVEKACRAR